MYIPIIVAASRKDSYGLKVGQRIFDLVKSEFIEVSTDLFTPNDFKIEFDDNNNPDPKFSEVTKNANGFIFIISEYNHGYPGRFKTLLDSEFKNYFNKKALLVGVSDGILGGARALENILPVLRALGLVVGKKDILFPEVKKMTMDNGMLNISARKEKIKEVIQQFVESF